MGRIRIALTISGAVSLGSFEGGALAALLTAVQALQPKPGEPPAPVRVDAIGAASAGSITAVAAARILTGGLDPTWVMEQAWVVQDAVEALLKNANLEAPLSMDGLNQMATGILNGEAKPELVQSACDVKLHLALCNLRGLEYKIEKLSKAPSEAIQASTYLDWGEFTFSPNADVGSFFEGGERSALNTALASGANEFGFPPKRLARSADDYKPNGLDNFPEGSGYLWFTDGGTIDNEPLGRTMDLANAIDSLDSDGGIGEDECRVHLLIHPFPSWPPGPDRLDWANPAHKPTWLRTLFRAAEVIRSQNLYSDIRRAEKTNSRIQWEDKILKTLDTLINALPAAQQTTWATELEGVVNEMESAVAKLPRHRHERPRTARDKDGTDASGLLHTALERITGLSGKNPVAIEVVSPYLAAGTSGLTLGQILAGEYLQSFGGFFDEGLRRSDFALGFVCMLNWMSTGLSTYGLDPDSVSVAVSAALDAFYKLEPWPKDGTGKSFTAYGLNEQLTKLAGGLQPTAVQSWVPTDFGEQTISSLRGPEKWQLLNVGRRVVEVVGTDVWLYVHGRDAIG